MATIETPTEVQQVDEDDARAVFDEQARQNLNMSGEEFLQAWDAGEFDADPDRPEVMRVVFLLPLVR
jgi:hypothetical protein